MGIVAGPEMQAMTPDPKPKPNLTRARIQVLLHKIIARLMKLLARRGMLVEEQGSSYLADGDADSDGARTLRRLQAAACTYRIAFGPSAG